MQPGEGSTAVVLWFCWSEFIKCTPRQSVSVRGREHRQTVLRRPAENRQALSWSSYRPFSPQTFPGLCSRGRAGIFTSQDQRQPLLLEMACLLTVCNDRRHLVLGYSPFLSPPPPITQLGGQHMPRQGALEDTSPSMLRSEVGRGSLASRTSFSASSNSTE